MIAARRAALAELLSTVDGVQGHLRQPGAARPGDAWPVWGALERGPGDAYLSTWRVIVVLPGDRADRAEAWIDTYLSDLVDTIDEHEDGGFVDRVEPVLVPIDTGDSPALQITLRTE